MFSVKFSFHERGWVATILIEVSPSKASIGQEQTSFFYIELTSAFMDASKTAKAYLISVTLLLYSHKAPEHCRGSNFFLNLFCWTETWFNINCKNVYKIKTMITRKNFPVYFLNQIPNSHNLPGRETEEASSRHKMDKKTFSGPGIL